MSYVNNSHFGAVLLSTSLYKTVGLFTRTVVM